MKTIKLLLLSLLISTFAINPEVLPVPFGIVFNGNSITIGLPSPDNKTSLKAYVFATGSAGAIGDEVFSETLANKHGGTLSYAVPGIYIVKLQAVGDGTNFTDSPLSDGAEWLIAEAGATFQLKTPFGVTGGYSPSTNLLNCNWGNGDSNASGYKRQIYKLVDGNYTLEQEIYIAGSGQGDIPGFTPTAGETYKIKIQAIGDGTNYSDSGLSGFGSEIMIPASSTTSFGSIKGTSVPLYTSGEGTVYGGDVTKPIDIAKAVVDYKVVTINGKSWIYTKFRGTSGLHTSASWHTHLRYWSVANAKTENNLTTSRNSTTKVILGSTSNPIPTDVRISIFQALVDGGNSETLITSYVPTIANCPVVGDVTAPTISACDVTTIGTTASLTISGSDNSGDLFYQIKDATNGINEIAFESPFILSGLALGVTYNLTITPIDFNSNEGTPLEKQFTTSSIINITTNTLNSSLPVCTTCALNIASGVELTVDASTTFQTITAAPAAKITVQAGITLTATSLYLQSDATGTATFVNNGTAAITTSSVQQYLATARNWYVSSPVSNAVLPSGFTTFKRDEVNSTWPTVTTGSALSPGVGYIVLPTYNNATITFSTETGGTLNIGEVSIPITKSGSGFNLIGNPYPCHLTWTQAFTDAATPASLIEPTIWYRTTSSGTNAGGWSFPTYNGHSGEGLNGGKAIIPPMQSFWIKTKKAGTLVLNNDLTKSHQSSNPLRAPAAKTSERQRLRLQLSNGIATDESLLFFDANALNSYDSYDSPKWLNNTVNVPDIYSLVGAEKLGMNGLNQLENNMEIALGFNTKETHDFVLKVSQLSDFDNDTHIYLLDKMENTETELWAGSEYPFSSVAVANNDTRFSVIFKSSALISGLDSDLSKGAVTVNSLNQVVILATVNTQYAVYNIVGQKLVEGNMQSDHCVVSDVAKAGAYVVTLSNYGRGQAYKIIIRK